MNLSATEIDTSLYPIRPTDLERARSRGPVERRTLRLIQTSAHDRELLRAQTHEQSGVVGEEAP